MESSLFARGSEWRKWDLHVHTPASITHQYTGSSDVWSAFLDELERLPSEFKVLGINDYIFLDGYTRLLREKHDNHRLTNIDLLLPVVELRLDKFGGSSGKLSRVNFHIIFSDELYPDIIQQHFLNALARSYQVTPQYREAAQRWQALPTRQSIEDLGRLIINSVPQAERRNFGSALTEGFNNLCFSLADIQEALKSHYFEQKFLTAVGKTEWADVKWNEQSIAEKKHIINSADLVFTASESPEAWQRAKRALTASGVNDRLLDCSDAHTWSTTTHKDRIGNSFTWIKADPTFAGLKQILNEPLDRIFVGDLPPKLQRVQVDKTRYIRNITIRKKPNAALRELWFDNEIPLNSGLVAVIGNKGKGKSAFVDTIGLLGNTRQRRAFSFLTEKGFCNPRDNKAQFFTATLTWESGTQNKVLLDSVVDETQPELVKYIPQNFLEVVCNEIGGETETGFDKELKKVIFSHVPESDRLRHSTLDALIAFRTEEAASRMLRFRLDLNAINAHIVDLETQDTPAHRMGIENRLKLKRQELEAHERTKPEAVPAPVNDPEAAESVKELAVAMNRLLEERRNLDAQIELAKSEQAEYAVQNATIEKAVSKIGSMRQQWSSFLAELEADCSRLGLQTKELVQITIDEKPLLRRRQEVAKKRSDVNALLDSSNPVSLITKRAELMNALTLVQKQLDEPNKRYQGYLRALEEWEAHQRILIGDETTVSSVKFFEKQLADLKDIPSRLAIEYDRRLAKAREIHKEISRLADVYRALYDPVQQFIDGNPIAQERFQLNFEVAIVLSGFESNFESFINHGVGGSFCGVDEGARFLRNILQKHDLGTEDGAVAFLTELVDCLRYDKRSGSGQYTQVSIAAQLRKGPNKSVTAFYDYIFSFEYLRPRYRLRMGEKELNQLSPGERGTLLLVFYLLVDKEQIPLVIDQPEENLDNQTVFELLVPCIKETKKRRQMIIVTHNPNLAVVCDAEQIICASLDKFDNYRMEYLGGAIENPLINRAIVNILEGTRPAFNNRDSKYAISK